MLFHPATETEILIGNYALIFCNVSFVSCTRIFKSKDKTNNFETWRKVERTSTVIYVCVCVKNNIFSKETILNLVYYYWNIFASEARQYKIYQVCRNSSYMYSKNVIFLESFIA